MSLVTLLGGHSLGYTNASISGYGFTELLKPDPTILNAWDSTPHVLDNGYYYQITEKVRLFNVFNDTVKTTMQMFL